MSDDRAKIIDKVKKLHLHATSAKNIGSEAEAQAFAATMQRLMSEHKILMSEVEHAQLDEKDPVDKILWNGDVPRGGGKRERSTKRVEWTETLAIVVAKAHYCKIILLARSSGLYFCGRESDRVACLETFTYLADCAAEIADKAYRKAYAAHQRGEGPWERGFHRSFLLGFATRLDERYQQEMADMKAKWAASGNALMRLTDALTPVTAWIAQRSGKGKSFRKSGHAGVGAKNRNAWELGRRAADDLKLKSESGKVSGAAKRLD